MTSITDKQTPNIAFLGICERAVQVHQGPPPLWKYNILGLKSIVLSAIYPISLTGFHFVTAIYDILNSSGARIALKSENGEELINFDIKFEETGIPQPPIKQSEVGAFLQSELPVWTSFLLPINNGLVKYPGKFNVFLLRDTQELIIGSLIFGLAPAEPLTDDRIAAIKSDPFAAKAIRYVLSCNQCNDAIKSYTGLDRSVEQEKNGFIWYEDLPDRFRCSCGKNDLDLTILRKNMHGLLGQKFIAEGDLSFTHLYEKEALEAIVSSFIELLDSDPCEEDIQQFIENNSILLHQLSPQRIFYKPSILGKYKADIIVVNQKKEMVLIELEKPGKRILKDDGGITADAQAPFTQVTDWLFLIDQHRTAVLDILNLNPSDVSKVRGVVIIGRDKGYNEEYLRKLKWTDFGRCEFNTYDDLVNGLVSLIRSMKSI